VGTRKPLRQEVHEGVISLSLSDKSIILCFTPLVAYESMRDPFGSLDDSSPLSLQFSSMIASECPVVDFKDKRPFDIPTYLY